MISSTELEWLEQAIEEGRVPSSFVVYDTETYCDIDIRECGAFKYNAHSSLELMMLQYLIIRDGEPTTEDVQIWEYGDLHDPKDFFQAVEEGLPLVVFNMEFERSLYELVLAPEYDYPVPKYTQWIDTAALARSLGIQGTLDATLAAFEIPYQKQEDGIHLIRRFCMPRKPSKNDDSTRRYPWDNPEHWERFKDYGRQDTRVTLALFTQTIPLSKQERQIMEANYRSNYRGLPIDTQSVETAIHWADRITQALTIRVKEITGGIGPNQSVPLAKWLGLKNIQAQTITTALATETDASKRAVLKARQVLGKTSISKLRKMLVCAMADDRVCGGFLYRGAARTGRDAGRLVQPHNFPRPTLKNDQIARVFELLKQNDYKTFTEEFPNTGEALSSCIRGMIAAPEGKEFCVADYAGIEARVLNWLAGQDDITQIFEKGGDVYVEMASVIFKVPQKKVTDEQRRLGKNTVLGCGYGMGAPKFREQLIDQGTVITPELAIEAVNAYRERHWKVKEAWTELEDAALRAISRPGKVVRVLNDKIAFQVKQIGINPFLFVRLPSGRLLAYIRPKARLRRTSWGQEKVTATFDTLMGSKVIPETTYGGKWIENIVQAIARDLMVNGVIHAWSNAYTILGTIHDELISEIKEGSKKDSKEFENLICQKPTWAEGLPLTADGYIAKRFRK